VHGIARFASSGRYAGLPGLRASRAFDGDPRTAWIGPWLPGRRAWVEWNAARPVTVRRLALRPAGARVRRTTRVVLRWPGGATPALPVTASGEVRLPRPIRTSRLRLEIAAARFPAGTSGRDRQIRGVGIAEVSGTGVRAGPPTRGRVARLAALASCGALRVNIGARILRLRPEGTVADLDAGRPLRARSCGPPVSLPSRRLELTTSSNVFLPYLLRLHSPAPAGPPAASGGGRVLDPGRERRAALDGVRLDVAGPSWLVLGESYNRGWRAWCDGRDLGSPRVVDAFANGWPLTAPCREARFAFAPDRTVKWAYAIGGLASLLLALVLVLRRPPQPEPAPAPPFDATAADRPPPRPWPRAIAIGLAAGAVLGFVFAIRAGVVIAPAVALIVRHGVGARPLVLGAAALLGIVLPALYVLAGPEDRGGFNPAYAVDPIAAHWVGAAALLLAFAALVRTITARSPQPARPPVRDPEPQRDPAPAA
jgi:arabinofuranan 3-O-arabinosyltransferase